jgi:hypothetical protein
VDLAGDFLRRVNEMNVETARDAMILAGCFAVLPSDLTGKIAWVSLFLGGLYYFNGKIPREL